MIKELTKTKAKTTTKTKAQTTTKAKTKTGINRYRYRCDDNGTEK